LNQSHFLMEANQQKDEVKKTHKKSEKEKRKARKERIENKKEIEPKIEQITETIQELKIETKEIEEIEEINEEEEAKKKKQWWPPMISSPNILNKLLFNLCGIKEFQFYDIFTFDEDYLKTLPQPTLGVFFCLPITENVKILPIKPQNDFKKNEKDEFLNDVKTFDEAYFFKQTICNSCSTLCICYLISNHLKEIKTSEAPLIKFILDSKEKTKQERNLLFEGNEGIAEAHFSALNKKIKDLNQEKKPEVKKEGTTLVEGNKKKKKKKKKIPQLMAHFICFTEMNGYLLELDSRRDSPIIRGESNPETVLDDSIKVIQKYFSYNSSLCYSVTLLAKNNELKE
jgi:ubiquitin carboxyl-terminal hydrolase L3